jgi:hypothetical protein
MSERDELWLTSLDQILALPRWWDDDGHSLFGSVLAKGHLGMVRRKVEDAFKDQRENGSMEAE